MIQVLVIEDDPEVRDNIVDTLEAAGFEVHDAANGRLGVQAARDNPPDVVVCDITMPELDGYEVLKTLRKIPTTNTVPFVFLTARTERTDQRLGMELGADDFVTKPFTQAELLTAINAQVAKRQVITEKHEAAMNKLRKSIVYALPHELRTPLTHIVGFTDVLNSDAEMLSPREVQEIAGFILKGANRLQRLIENYLVYVQLEFASDNANALEALTNHMLRDASVVIDTTARQKATDVGRLDDLNLELEPATIRISPEDLRKIIEELTENAFKFSQPGTAVQVKSSTANHRYTVTIRDHGTGLTAEQIAQLGAYIQFNREFYEQQGIGLGFVIAKRLIDMYNGQIEVHSAPGEGTTIRFSFPIEAH